MDAVMSFRKMITVIDPDSKFNKYFAEILDQNLDYQNAKKIFTSYEFLYKLGRLFYDIDLRIEASRYFRRCLKLKPFDKMALRYQNTLSL